MVTRSASAPSKKPLLKRMLRFKWFYAMLLPVVVWYFVFCYIPMYGIVMAFQNFRMGRGYFAQQWIGLANFQELFTDMFAMRAFANTFIIALMRIVFEFPVPILLALLFNEMRARRYRKVVQTVVYLPHFLSWVIVASIAITMFSPEKGLLQAIFQSMGRNAPDILSSAPAFRWVLVLSDIWKESGWSTIIYVAAMGAIDPHLYEAAVTDGAGRWRLIWHVTIPGIRNVIAIVLILNMGSVLGWGFDQVFNFYNGLVYETGDILSTYIYRTAMADSRFSYAAAAGLLQSLICLTVLTISNAVVKMMGEESIY